MLIANNLFQDDWFKAILNSSTILTQLKSFVKILISELLVDLNFIS